MPRLVAVVLAMQMLFLPAPVSAAAIGNAIRSSSVAAAEMREGLLSWLALSPSQAPNAWGVKSPPPERKSDKIARLARLQINPKGAVRLESREQMFFTAVPFDSEGSAIHGLQAEWESSDRQVVFVKRDGEAVAGRPGAATVTARAGSLSASVQVIIVKGDGEPFGKTKADSTRNNLRVRQSPTGSARESFSRTAGKTRTHHRTRQQSASVASRLMFLRDPNDDPLPDNETNSLFKPINTVGSPPGRTRGGATAPAPSIGATETNGNKNFTFALPVAGLPGRGISASLSLVYNSAVWNKSTAPSSGNTWMTYDVD